jgi:hypothetical protein
MIEHSGKIMPLPFVPPIQGCFRREQMEETVVSSRNGPTQVGLPRLIRHIELPQIDGVLDQIVVVPHRSTS